MHRERELEQYTAIEDVASEAFVTIDARSVIQSVNPAVTEIFGYEPDELVEQPLMVLMPERFTEQHYQNLQRYLETGERNLNWEYIELPGLHKAGHEVPLAISFSEYEYESDRYFTGIIRDNSDRKRLERQLEEAVEELEEANRQLEASNERLEQFASAASHDIQAPLQMVAGYLELLEQTHADALDEEAEEYIETVLDGVDRMSAMNRGAAVVLARRHGRCAPGTGRSRGGARRRPHRPRSTDRGNRRRGRRGPPAVRPGRRESIAPTPPEPAGERHHVRRRGVAPY